jgi:phage terminase small subunit
MEDVMGYDICLLEDPRHEVFCRKFAANNNATKSYMIAFPGCSYESARAAGSRLLAENNIKVRIAQIQKERLDRIEVTDQKIINELAKLAFTKEDDFYHENGRVKAPHELDPHDAAAVQSRKIKVVELFDGKGKDAVAIGTATTTEFKLHSKTDALQLLMRHRKMLTDKVEMDHGFKDLSDEDLIKRAKALHAELGIGD